jgi:hypothetical protein
LGLICFPPDDMIELPTRATKPAAKPAAKSRAATPAALKRYAYRTSAVWVEVERNDEAFLNFVANAVKLITRPTMPRSAPNCGWCRWTRMTAPLLEQTSSDALAYTSIDAA